MKTNMQSQGNRMASPLVVLAGALVCCALWGSAFPMIKLGYKAMGDISARTCVQILYAGCRFFLAGVLTVVMASIGGRKLLRPERIDELPRIIRLSFLQTIAQYIFFYVGLAHTTGVRASIIQGVNVFVALLVAVLLFHQEKLTARKVIGCLIGFAGVVIINLTGSSQAAGTMLGDICIFLSTVAYAFSTVFLKRFSTDSNTVMLSGYQFMFGGAVMAAAGWISGGRLPHFSTASLAILLYLAFVSAAAYTLWGLLLKYNPVSRVTVFGFMTPVFGVILSSVLLKEGAALGPEALAALVLVCIGIYLVNRK